ncbi:hypothetical protein H0H92_006615, partial [Tricholoma furcatifolium]
LLDTLVFPDEAQDKIRRARCAKVHLNGKICFAEVQFFFQAAFGPEYKEDTLALVSLYSDRDEALFTESYCTIWSVTELGNEGLQVIPVKSVESVVAIIPHQHRVPPFSALPRYFVWEQMGLDMAVIADSVRDEDED